MITEINVHEADAFYHLATLCRLIRTPPYQRLQNQYFIHPLGNAAIIFTYTLLHSLALEPIFMPTAAKFLI